MFADAVIVLSACSYELGSGTANITSTERIDDGLPHHVVATRYDVVL